MDETLPRRPRVVGDLPVLRRRPDELQIGLDPRVAVVAQELPEPLVTLTQRLTGHDRLEDVLTTAGDHAEAMRALLADLTTHGLVDDAARRAGPLPGHLSGDQAVCAIRAARAARASARAAAALSNPASPTDPDNPVGPTDPTNPTNPTDPTGPANPTDSPAPAKPANQAGSVSPTDLAGLAHRAIPSRPVSHSHPADPASTAASNGAEPPAPTSHPAGPTAPAAPTSAAKPAGSANTTDPGGPAHPSGPADPAGSASPTDSGNPARPSDPASPAEPANPTGTTDRTGRTGPASPTSQASSPSATIPTPATTPTIAIPRPDSPATRRALAMIVQGDGRLAVATAALLASAGVGWVHVRATGTVRPEDTGTGYLADDVGRRRAAAARDAVRRADPTVRTGPCRRDRGPDLVILTDAVVPEPSRVTALTEAGVPHLTVRMRDGTGIVGPLVVPGLTSCLRCADLRRCDSDECWPHLAAQLAGKVQQADLAGTQATAAFAAAQALEAVRWLQGTAGPPATCNATVELDVYSADVRHRAWPAHAACSCGAGVGCANVAADSKHDLRESRCDGDAS